MQSHLSLTSALAGTLLIAPASAQTVATTISPLKVEADGNGVNILTGQARVAVPTLSVPAAPRLTFDLLQNAMPHLTAMISGSPGNYTEGSIAVQHGGAASESFKCTYDDYCTDVKRSGATIEGNIPGGGPYTFVGSQTGAVYNFNSLEYDSGFGPSTRRVQYYATSITYPDGEVISLTYQKTSGAGRTLHRLTRMSSNIGYHIDFAYRSNTGSEAAWRYLAQASLYKSDAPSTPLGRLTYNTNQTITDLAGRVTTCIGCTNAPGAQVEVPNAQVTLPGEAAAHRIITGSQLIANNLTIPPVVTSINNDGVNWSYSYGNFRTAPEPVKYTYDNVVVSGPNGYNQRYNVRAVVSSAGTYRTNLIDSVVDSLGRTTSYQYDGNWRPTLVTRPEGDSVQIDYDNYGNIVSKISRAKPNSGLAAITETTAIDQSACASSRVQCFRPVSFTDGRNQTSNYAYDGGGRLTQLIAPADATGARTATYLEYGSSFTAPTVTRVCTLNVTCGTAAEIRTEITYWGNTALPLTAARVDGATGQRLTTSYSYDSAGRLLSRDGPLAGTDDTTFFRYDVLGRKTWEISGRDAANNLWLATRYTYRNSDDQIVATEMGYVTDPYSQNLVVHQRTDMSYDGRRNPVRSSLSAQGSVQKVTQSSFDDRGRPECTAVRMNPAVYGSLPASACDLWTQGSNGPDRITRMMYDAGDQVLQIRKGVGTGVEIADATYSYTLNGKIQDVIDANGNRARLEYDGFDRQSRWIFPSQSRPGGFNPANQATALASAGGLNAGDYEQYGYDANGNRTSFRRRDGRTLAYQYDALNRMIVKSVPDGNGLAGYHTRDVYYGYDLRGLPTYARFDNAGSGAEGVSNTYDAFGRIASERSNQASLDRTLTFQHDANGNRTRVTWPDTTYASYGFDALNRWTGASWRSAAGPASDVPFHSSAYNNAGQLTDTFQRSSHTQFGYNPAGQLGSMGQGFLNGSGNTTSIFTRNAAGQITSRSQSNQSYSWTGHVNVNRSYTTNGLNQYTAVGSGSLCHDVNGNLTADATYAYRYDVENRLVELRSRDGTGCPTLTGGYNGQLRAALRYDPLGRLHEIERYSGGAGQGAQRFQYDGDAMVAEYAANGTMLRRYVHGPIAGIDDPILVDEGTALNCSSTRVLHRDERGSIIAQADCSGNRTAVNTYDEYGIPGPSNTGRYQYTGQVWLPELGVYYYKARMYSPTLGRFMQTDPIGYKDQVNLYAYVGNDPLNGTDPSGMCTGSLISNSDGTCKGMGAFNPGPHINPTLSGPGTVTGPLPSSFTNSSPSSSGSSSSLIRSGGGDFIGKLLGDRSFQRWAKFLFERTERTGKEWSYFILRDSNGNYFRSRFFEGYARGECPSGGPNACTGSMDYNATRFRNEGNQVPAFFHTHPDHARLSDNDRGFSNRQNLLVISYGPYRGGMEYDWYKRD